MGRCSDQGGCTLSLSLRYLTATALNRPVIKRPDQSKATSCCGFRNKTQLSTGGTDSDN